MEPRGVNKTRAWISMPTSIVGQNWERPSQSSPVGQRFGDDKNDISTGFPSTGNVLGTLSSKTGVILTHLWPNLWREKKKITEIMELENFIGKRL